jgi:hypothetical protein
MMSHQDNLGYTDDVASSCSFFVKEHVGAAEAVWSAATGKQQLWPAVSNLLTSASH